MKSSTSETGLSYSQCFRSVSSVQSVASQRSVGSVNISLDIDEKPAVGKCTNIMTTNEAKLYSTNADEQFPLYETLVCHIPNKTGTSRGRRNHCMFSRETSRVI